MRNRTVAFKIGHLAGFQILDHWNDLAKVCLLDPLHLDVDNRAPRNEHDILAECRIEMRASKHLAQQPLGPIPGYGVSDASTSHYPQAHLTPLGGQDETHKILRHPAPAASIGSLEIGFPDDPASAVSRPTHTAIRCRPLRRRRPSTARPPFVFMRARKPCTFFRRLRLGWKVLFI